MLIRTQPSGGGWLCIDHSAGGQLPPGLNQRVFEADTYTCTHCQRVVVLNPARQRERYKCRGCDHHICDPCAALRTAGAPCRTFAQLADEVMAQAERQAEAPRLILPTN